PAAGQLRPVLAQSGADAAPAVADGFSRFQPRNESAQADDPQRLVKARYVKRDDEVKAKLEAEIARLEAEIAALSGKAAALESSDVAIQALKAKDWADLIETEVDLQASAAALEALGAHDWGKLVQEHTGKLKGLKLDSKDGHQIVTWSGADGQTGYGLFDGDAENIIYFDGQEGSSDSGDIAEWLNGEDGNAWIEKLDGGVAVFGELGGHDLWTEDGDGHNFWKEIAAGADAHGDGDIKVIVQGHDGKPTEVHGKVVVNATTGTPMKDVIRVIDSIKAHGDGKYDITVSTTDDGDVIEKYTTRYVDGQNEYTDAKALFETIKAVPGQRIHGDVNVLYKDALNALKSTGAPHDGDHQEEIVLFKRALEHAHKSGGQNPFVQRVEVHNHGGAHPNHGAHSEHDDLRDLLEAMAADLTEVRHEVKAIRALLEGGEPLGMAPAPVVPGFPVRTTSAPGALHLHSAEPGQIASLFGVASGVRAPEPTVVGSLTGPGHPIAVGQPVEPIAVGQPIAPIAVGQPIEPIVVGTVTLDPAELPVAPAPIKVLSLPAGQPKDAPNN
ncbi:MAG: hypothetical protein ACYS26_01030, partial [Planctomycetota bacterium]